MAAGDNYIGRQELVGFGIEGTPGTAVAPQNWFRWLEQNLQPMTEVVENDSALGRVEKVNDSAVASKWVEGPLGGKVSSEGVGFLLLGMFGSVSTGAAVSGIYPHTFSVSQVSLPKTLTIAHVTPLASKRYAYAVLDNLELTAETGAYVQVSSQVKARIGATSTERPAYIDEKEFTSKHVTMKMASTTGGLGAASAIKARSVKLTFERTAEKFDPMGTDDAPEFDRGAWEAKGEIVVRYNVTDYETDFLANTVKALGLYIADGTTKLEFTGAKVRIRELEKSVNRDEIVTQTLSLYFELDETTGTTIVPVLSNSRATYAAA